MNHRAMDLIMVLEHHNMFESTAHRARFGDLVECYSGFPFFTAGLCKCMYLAAMDDAHFADMLDILNTLTLGGTRDTEEMEENGKVEEERREGRERELFHLSGALLTGTPYIQQCEELDEETQHIINLGLKASMLIDEVLEDEQDE